MTVRRRAPASGASHRRAASLDRRFQPVRSKPYRSSAIWARPPFAASVRRSGRCGRDGPDSRSGRSSAKLINPGRFDKNFRVTWLERIDQEPVGNRAAAVSRGIISGFLRTNPLPLNRQEDSRRASGPPTIMICVLVNAGSEPTTRVPRSCARLRPARPERRRTDRAGRSRARSARTIHRDKQKARLSSRAFASRYPERD